MGVVRHHEKGGTGSGRTVRVQSKTFFCSTLGHRGSTTEKIEGPQPEDLSLGLRQGVVDTRESVQ